jgi:hypothetical protein
MTWALRGAARTEDKTQKAASEPPENFAPIGQAMGGYAHPCPAPRQPSFPLRGRVLGLDGERGADEGGAEAEDNNYSENQLLHFTPRFGVPYAHNNFGITLDRIQCQYIAYWRIIDVSNGSSRKLGPRPIPSEKGHQAVALVTGKLPLEASGGITLDTIAAIAATGVDYASSGWITHSAPNLDVALDIEM